jgi:hypothetical protein
MILKGYEFEMSGVKRVCGRAVCRSKGERAAWIDLWVFLPQPYESNAGLRADGYMRRSVRWSAGECCATPRNGHDDRDITCPSQ